jgi:pentatricopeptide repeat protein
MLENGLSPSIAIYNTLLKAMFQRGKVCEFISLVKTMVMEGCQTNEQTFEILN